MRVGDIRYKVDADLGAQKASFQKLLLARIQRRLEVLHLDASA